MCYVIINFGFARYIVDVIATTYQKGVFAIIQFFHSGDASCLVEIWKAAYSCPFRIFCVKCFHSHAIAFLMFHTEVIIAGEKEDKEETVYEISDLAYHVLVLMVSAGITVEDVTRELEKRHVIDHKVKQERMQ